MNDPTICAGGSPDPSFNDSVRNVLPRSRPTLSANRKRFPGRHACSAEYSHFLKKCSDYFHYSRNYCAKGHSLTTIIMLCNYSTKAPRCKGELCQKKLAEKEKNTTFRFNDLKKCTKRHNNYAAGPFCRRNSFVLFPSS